MVSGLCTLLALEHSSVLAKGDPLKEHWGNIGYLNTEF